ncbi:MAG: type I restriction enzyme S subunit [Cyclobacteriaceae bacterium]|jgi:type I restriction enzyme S subunit
MEEIMEKIDLKNLDKSNWKTYRFDQIAKKVSETVDPNTTDLDIYIGLEHLDAESIHIKRRGTPSDVSGGKLKCYPGDIIFGKRRAYQRKAAIVDFEGICSAHAFVLRAIPEVMDPKLFPFFLHSDLFMHCAVDISVGGLSPTINWGQLKEQEFFIPPKEQQAQLAELLWAMDEVIERENAVEQKLKITRDVYFENLIIQTKGEKVPLSKILISKKGKSQVPHVRDKYIGLEHIDSGEFETHRYGGTDSVLAQCNIVEVGDLCYSKLRSYLDKAIIATFDAVSTTELLIYNTKLVSKEYVLYHLHSRPFINYVTGQGYGGKMPRVSHKIIGEFSILVPKNEGDILKKMDPFLKNSKIIQEKISSSQSLQKSLINQIF